MRGTCYLFVQMMKKTWILVSMTSGAGWFASCRELDDAGIRAYATSLARAAVFTGTPEAPCSP